MLAGHFLYEGSVKDLGWIQTALAETGERFKETQRKDSQPGTVAGEYGKTMWGKAEREMTLWI